MEKLVRASIERLKEKELIEFKADEKKVYERMVEIFVGDLKAEDDLDKEVEALLKSHSGAMDSQRVDYRKMFSMIKNKLARERGIVL
ncbi:MAG: hypothetical protein A2054_04395 [Deltaproteobacteria bacterium GWA2_55_10]|nr:MAG: hypothetical protein A2054_04395 [Deltaproteobacteria bacterium GWA2_55_10]